MTSILATLFGDFLKEIAFFAKVVPAKRKFRKRSPRGGVGGYSHTLRIRVCAAQRGSDFEAPDLERGINLRDVF